MKKILSILALAGFTWILVACGGSKSDEKKTDDPYGDYETAEPKKASAEEIIAEGKALVESSDCKTCHKPDTKLVGPGHKEVADKYEFTEANVKMLADKIIKGGSGNWGEVLMNSHPNVSQADAEKMARYVLSLDGEKEH